MFFEKRKAYIEFFGQTTVNIVNVYYNKVFELKRGCTVDLMNLKMHEGICDDSTAPSNFFATFIYDEEEKYFDCYVYMKTSEDDFEEIGSCSMRDNKKTFGGSVWVRK